MKSKKDLIVAILQLGVGIIAIAAYLVLRLFHENSLKWTITFVLAVVYVVLGVIRFIDYKSDK